MPCNKDLRNQGLTYSQPTGSYEIVDDGPYGKCVHTTSAGSINTNVKSVDGWNVPTSCGFGAWLKFNLTEMRYASAYTYSSTNTCIHNCVLGYGSYGGFSLDLESNNINTDGAFNSAILRPDIRFGSSIKNGAQKAIVFGEWHHYYTQWDNTRKALEFYYDGNLFWSGTNASQVVSGIQQTFVVNGGMVWGGNPPGKCLPYYVADVRVYQGVVTEEEVKNIYKTKVFDLDTNSYIKGGGTMNYAYYTNTEATLGWSSYGFGSHGKIYRADIETPLYGYPIKILASGGTGNFAAEAARWVTATPLSNGGKITFSYYAKGVGTTIGKSTQAHIYNSSGSTTVSTGTNGLLTADWKRYSHTLTWTGSTLSSPSFSIYCVGTSFVQDEYFYACNFQLELGDKATNYIPALGISELPVDMSGYAPPFSATNVIKSGGTIYFDGTSSIISTQLDFGRLFDSNYTFSFWVNSEDATSSRSIYFGCGGQGNGWTLSLERLSSSLIFRAWNDQKPDYTESNFKINNNEWTHVGFVKSGTTVYSYKNGVLVGSKAGFSAHTLFDRTYYLGGDYRMGDILYKGYLGDFKIYANAFTSAEMLDLYNKEKIKYQ